MVISCGWRFDVGSGVEVAAYWRMFSVGGPSVAKPFGMPAALGEHGVKMVGTAVVVVGAQPFSPIAPIAKRTNRTH